MAAIIVQNKQSIYDVALQYCGSITAVPELCRLNNIAPHEDIEAGTVLQCAAVVNKRIVDKYKENEIQPATGGNLEDFFFSGIDFMGIEFDFIVS